MVTKKEQPITEAFDALKRIEELERENKNLIKRNKLLRYRLLKEDERRGVENSFKMLNPNADLIWWQEREDFRVNYIDYKNSLPAKIDDMLFE